MLKQMPVPLIVGAALSGAILLWYQFDKVAANAMFQERCVSRGGYWLRDSIQVHDTLTRCIEQPKPIMVLPMGTSPWGGKR